MDAVTSTTGSARKPRLIAPLSPVHTRGLSVATVPCLLNAGHTLNQPQPRFDGTCPFHVGRPAGVPGPLVTYGDVANAVLGRWGKRAVDVQLVLLEGLFNAGFIIVSASTLHKLHPVRQLRRHC